MFNGLAKAIIDPVVFETKPTIVEELTRIVESRFRAAQILTHNDYNLTRPSRSDIKEDGSRNYYLEVNSAEIKITVGKVDFTMKDKAGNVMADTKRERLDRQKWFADHVARFRPVDGTLDKMLASCQMSVKYPNNEYIYLREIRDAVTSKFHIKLLNL